MRLRKRAITGELVHLLFHASLERGMELLNCPTRCIKAGEIHELVTTDERDLTGGSKVNRVGFLGFLEFQHGGVIERGDSVYCGDVLLGIVVGFDGCHFPNHYNIIISSTPIKTADSLKLDVGDEICFIGRAEDKINRSQLSLTDKGEMYERRDGCGH